ncbi:flagellar hook-associated protein FlgK [Fuscibacter oryzae]|uniref:Flagellar hook-associated protein 1 n=1 Tax=Fuscibacter oryzae TaxID=2803939 RepID=A0A8J7MVM1_9RHOB|nr:flagellar hook-associated protein FlgK [Fuscibacter oryzae]MBL4928384.1 flagellar hook-associated protein FlgK [Fuscibacter oryzae]
MSLSAGFASAISGLTAVNKQVEVISNNIANATTPGYSRRELVTTAWSAGGQGLGVRIIGVSRQIDLALQNDRRVAAAADAGNSVTANALKTIEQAIGTTDSTISLQSRIADFDSRLIEAASRPDSEARLQAVVSAARALTEQIGSAATKTQTLRSQADAAIASKVEGLNTSLARVVDLNSQIRMVSSGGNDPSALMDQRQQLIDQISNDLPVRVIQRDNGAVALFGTGGAVLLDGTASTFGFTATGFITADLSLAGGTLSGLTLNSRPISTASDDSPLAGGALIAQFTVRDEIAVEVQGRLDAVARDLVERFATPGLDDTLPGGAAGLFTDSGQAFDPADETGLAQRLTLNPAADLEQGGAIWRIRDGLGSASSGDSGATRLLVAYRGALQAQRLPVSGGFMPGQRSFAALASDLVSGVGSDRLTAESEQGFAAAKALALSTQEAAGGVDSDQEMQALLVMEKAYAANAKVISALGSMIDRLLEM